MSGGPALEPFRRWVLRVETFLDGWRRLPRCCDKWSKGKMSGVSDSQSEAQPVKCRPSMLWRVSRPIRTSKPPGFILPCQPALADRPPAGPGWLHEITFDGYGVIARKDGERVRLWRARPRIIRAPSLASASPSPRCRSIAASGGLVFVEDSKRVNAQVIESGRSCGTEKTS
jgi:hypothetical protein